MKLSQLISTIREPLSLRGPAEVELTGLAYDSRRVAPGNVFFALAKDTEQRRQHVQEALSRGAQVVVVEVGWGAMVRPAVTIIECHNPRKVMAQMASYFFGSPSKRLDLIGITGTAGKTTTSFLLSSIFRAAGHPSGVIGTLGGFADDERLYEGLTTPEAIDFEAVLADMLRRGIKHIAAEVSSIGLAQHRVDELHFRAAVFTNLGHDHLDFHHTMENYFSAKLKLFTEILPRTSRPDPIAVVRGDDSYGRRVLAAIGLRKVSFGFDGPYDVKILSFDATTSGLLVELEAFGQRLSLRSPLLGAVNVPNIAAAVATALALGFSKDAVIEGIGRCTGVPGRLERIPNNRGIIVLVDYAHKPEALEITLKSLRALTRGRLFCVFGCGGERDREKRPMMGRIASQLADITVITSDNPRGEEPLFIIREILNGISESELPKLSSLQELQSASKGYLVEADRQKAIELALLGASQGDTVLIAGKGHETYQIIGGQKRHFDDREVARDVLNRGTVPKPCV